MDRRTWQATVHESDTTEHTHTHWLVYMIQILKYQWYHPLASRSNGQRGIISRLLALFLMVNWVCKWGGRRRALDGNQELQVYKPRRILVPRSRVGCWNPLNLLVTETTEKPGKAGEVICCECTIKILQIGVGITSTICWYPSILLFLSYSFIEVYLFCSGMLASAVQWGESVMCMCICPPSWTSFSTPQPHASRSSRALSWAPCAFQQLPTSCPSYTRPCNTCTSSFLQERLQTCLPVSQCSCSPCSPCSLLSHFKSVGSTGIKFFISNHWLSNPGIRAQHPWLSGSVSCAPAYLAGSPPEELVSSTLATICQGKTSLRISKYPCFCSPLIYFPYEIRLLIFKLPSFLNVMSFDYN